MFTRHPDPSFVRTHLKLREQEGFSAEHRLGELLAMYDAVQRDHARLLDAIKGYEWVVDPTPATADVEDQAADCGSVPRRTDAGHEYMHGGKTRRAFERVLSR